METALPTDTDDIHEVSAKRVIETGSLGVIRKTESSVMGVGHRPTNLRAGDAREQLTRDLSLEPLDPEAVHFHRATRTLNSGDSKERVWQQPGQSSGRW